jgi:uncharacterized protein
MQIDVHTLPEGRSRITRTITEFGDDIEWPSFAEGLALECVVDRTQHEVAVSVSFSGSVVLQCARCLSDVQVPVQGSFVLLAREAGKQEQTGYTDSDSLEFLYDREEKKIDLGQAVYDESMTALPMKPLCREDCQGIEMDGTAGGNGSPIDPRWEALRKLKERGGGAG